MINKAIFINSGKGVLRGFFITLVILFLLSVINMQIEISSGIRSSALLVTTLISIVYGSIYASRKTGKMGWINGFLVSIFYMILFYIIARLGGSDIVLGIKDIIRVLIAMVVGILAGMLGINI